MRKLFLAAMLTSGAAIASPALAQQATAENVQSEADSTDIVVTAQRSSERLQDVPVSVQALSADTLRNAGVNDQRQLALLAPSLQLQQNNNYAVRGVRTQSSANTVAIVAAISTGDVVI